MSALLFAGVDQAVFAATFADRLRRAGIAVPLTSTERCGAAMAAVRPRRLDDLYWVTRVSFVRDVDQLARFDAVFDALSHVAVGPATSWRARRVMGKALSVCRLFKSAFTFDDPVDYLLWKIERHSGVRETATPLQRKYPLVFAWPLVWRLYQKGAFR